MRKTIAIFAGVLACLGASASAAGEVVSIRVSAADLDLTIPEHVEMLEQRVVDAAVEACTAPYAPVAPDLLLDRVCRDDLIEKAAQRIAEMQDAALARAQAEEIAAIL